MLAAVLVILLRRVAVSRLRVLRLLILIAALGLIITVRITVTIFRFVAVVRLAVFIGTAGNFLLRLGALRRLAVAVGIDTVVILDSLGRRTGTARPGITVVAITTVAACNSRANSSASGDCSAIQTIGLSQLFSRLLILTGRAILRLAHCTTGHVVRAQTIRIGRLNTVRIGLRGGLFAFADLGSLFGAIPVTVAAIAASTVAITAASVGTGVVRNSCAARVLIAAVAIHHAVGKTCAGACRKRACGTTTQTGRIGLRNVLHTKQPVDKACHSFIDSLDDSLANLEGHNDKNDQHHSTQNQGYNNNCAQRSAKDQCPANTCRSQTPNHVRANQVINGHQELTGHHVNQNCHNHFYNKKYRMSYQTGARPQAAERRRNDFWEHQERTLDITEDNCHSIADTQNSHTSEQCQSVQKVQKLVQRTGANQSHREVAIPNKPRRRLLIGIHLDVRLVKRRRQIVIHRHWRKSRAVREIVNVAI